MSPQQEQEQQHSKQLEGGMAVAGEKKLQKRIIVFISGGGTNLQALIDACANGTLENTRIALVISNRTNAYGLQRAANAGIPTLTHILKAYRDQGKSRIEYDLDLVKKIDEALSSSNNESGGLASINLAVLAGFMHILSADFINAFPKNSIINLHPALPGAFDGAKAIERAFEAFGKGEIKETGVMVHRCIPEVDRGDVIVQQVCPIHSTDSLHDLEDRIHSIEHRLIVQGVDLALSLSLQ